MKAEEEQSTQEKQIREALNAHWQASAAGDANAEHDIYDDDAICDYPQSGERILGRNNLQALRSHHPGKPSGFQVKRILGRDDLWITEYTIVYQGRSAYTVSIMEFCNGKVVHETQYFADPFEAAAWRRQWVQQIVPGNSARPAEPEGNTTTNITSFAEDIRPLFTDRDIEQMRKGFNLASYEEVRAHASAIYDRIRGIGGAIMPPPPPRGEGPWPQSRIDLFAKWLADGCKP